MFENFFEKLFKKEVILYIVFGVLTTIVDALVFYLANNILKINYILATILAWVFAVLFAYVTNKVFVFKSKYENKQVLKEIFYFFSLRLVSLCFTILFMVFTVEILKIDEFLAKILVNVFVVIANYFFSKIFIFK